MSSMEEIRRRTNSPLLAVEGRILKSGPGWIFIEEEAESYTTTMRVKNEEGEEVKETVEVMPYKAMICYQKAGAARFEKKFADHEGETLTFTVTAKADINRKNKNLEVRYWLVDVFTTSEYIDQLEVLAKTREALAGKIKAKR